VRHHTVVEARHGTSLRRPGERSPGSRTAAARNPAHTEGRSARQLRASRHPSQADPSGSQRMPVHTPRCTPRAISTPDVQGSSSPPAPIREAATFPK
jgi:hypothetical protein